MGSNMAEAHPCAFYWPMQAKKKGAVTIHVDPRYTRTSAACDLMCTFVRKRILLSFLR